MILITGGTGLVGSHLLYELTSSNNSVIALKRETSKLDKIKATFSCYTKDYQQLLDKIKWVNGDVKDIKSLDQITNNIDTIYHCAALVSFNPKDKENIHNTNIQGTKNIVDICIKKNIRLCFVSSIATLGDNKKGLINENTARDPKAIHSEYSTSKSLSEKIIWEGIAKGLDAIIVNPSIILGFGHWDTGSSLLIRTIANGLKLYTKGIVGYVDVRDLCKAMHLLCESQIRSERFILNQGNYSYQEIFTLIAENLDLKPPYIHATPFLTNIIWRIAKLFEIITKRKANFTKETSRSSHNISKYSGEKITKEIPQFTYTPFEKTIKDICTYYKQKDSNK